MNKNKIDGQFRQGDVLIQESDTLPEKSTKQKTGRVILAHGEVTGHAHEIECDSADAWKDGDETVAVEVKKKTAIKHQEHAPIPIKPKIYKIRRQCEYSPTAMRPVAD
jgi:uncharacterized protein YjhX (UPF0386 family)